VVIRVLKKIFNRDLNDFEKFVVFEKGTEAPFTGEYENHFEKGVYVCKNCGIPLYTSNDKFDSGCGWPAFDDEIPGAVLRQPDRDGRRTEITCAYCGAHLGHVFQGEKLTSKNVRHCVNSVSLKFIPEGEKPQIDRMFFAGGCFWGVEHLFKGLEGVFDTRVGYMGGHLSNPTYEKVCMGLTGHYETVEVIFEPKKVDEIALVRYFFEIHDFTQENGQGPDIGEQYKSVIFYTNDHQKQVAEEIISELKKKYKVATQLRRASTFWLAEEYHQDYYAKTGKAPYCHFRRKIF